ncbi:MAG: hypothetical protein H8E66_04545 [Planctomycetes bacterium]|nr:hypothetical protein [Planctomycetota bacterium]
MADSQDKSSYLDIDDLVIGKKAGKIPFFQPGGKSGRVKFPENAIEFSIQSETPRSSSGDNESSLAERLPGPQPGWMSPSKQKP